VGCDIRTRIDILVSVGVSGDDKRLFVWRFEGGRSAENRSSDGGAEWADP
jgi:hypothetical protein